MLTTPKYSWLGANFNGWQPVTFGNESKYNQAMQRMRESFSDLTQNSIARNAGTAPEFSNAVQSSREISRKLHQDYKFKNIHGITRVATGNTLTPSVFMNDWGPKTIAEATLCQQNNICDIFSSGNEEESRIGKDAIISLVAASNIVTATFGFAHGYLAGDKFTLSGASPSQFNGNFVVSAVPTSKTLTFSLVITDQSATTPTTITVTSLVVSNNQVTATFPVAHGFIVGDSVTFSGATPSQLNGQFTVAVVPTSTTLRFNLTLSNQTATGTITSGSLNLKMMNATYIRLAKYFAVLIRQVFFGKVIFSFTTNLVTDMIAAGFDPNTDFNQVGLNSYGASATDLSGFKTPIDQCFQAWGNLLIVTEWNVFFTWSLAKTQLGTQVRIAEEVKKRAKILDYYGQQGVICIFHTWVFTGDDWSLYGHDHDFYFEMYYALFNGRPAFRGVGIGQSIPMSQFRKIPFSTPAGTNKYLATNGITDNASIPIIPSNAGICVGFWYKRMRFAVTEENIIGNLTLASGFIKGFRIYHDANSQDLVLHVSSTGGVFSVLSSFPYQLWNYISAVINPGVGAQLYINGNPVGTLLAGSMSTPVQNLILGARAGDLLFPGQFEITNLIIENNPAIFWNQARIIDLMNNNDPVAAASYYTFNNSAADQSGNGNDLSLTGTSYGIVTTGTIKSLKVNRPKVLNRPRI